MPTNSVGLFRSFIPLHRFCKSFFQSFFQSAPRFPWQKERFAAMNGPEQLSRDRHLRHLKNHLSGMAHDLRPDLDQFVLAIWPKLPVCPQRGSSEVSHSIRPKLPGRTPSFRPATHAPDRRPLDARLPAPSHAWSSPSLEWGNRPCRELFLCRTFLCRFLLNTFRPEKVVVERMIARGIIVQSLLPVPLTIIPLTERPPLWHCLRHGPGISVCSVSQ